MLFLDEFSLFFNVIFLAGTGLCVLISVGYLRREGASRGEYYLLMLAATIGMMLMAAGADLVVIFLGLELLSISLYVLAGFLRDRRSSNEAALKYLLLGAFATGFLLYGISLVYGATGTTSLRGIELVVSRGQYSGRLMLLTGGLLMLVGLAFKVAAVPFHMWAPDVYEGAPTSVTAFMSAGPKAAAFAALLRVLMFSLGGLRGEWVGALWVLSALTMTVGNLGALTQRSTKRMLAYSSVAHAGYVLVALSAASERATAAALFYLLTYAIMSIGAFCVVVLAARRGEENLDVSSLAGLGFRQPGLALAMTVFMVSLAGLPPTGGFFGKFGIFSAAVESGLVGLVVIGVLNSLVSVYFYLGVVVSMYMQRSEVKVQKSATPLLAGAAVVVASLATLYLGLLPSTVLGLAEGAAASLGM